MWIEGARESMVLVDGISRGIFEQDSRRVQCNRYNDLSDSSRSTPFSLMLASIPMERGPGSSLLLKENRRLRQKDHDQIAELKIATSSNTSRCMHLRKP